MRIGVISDTHGNLQAFNTSLKVLGEIDMLIHVGDVLYHPPRLGFTEGYDIPQLAEAINNLDYPVLISQGNCDSQVYEELLDVPMMHPYAYAQMGTFGILASHGHFMEKHHLIELASRFRAKAALSGHTHIPIIEKIGGIVYMNPGSPALPKHETDGISLPTVGLLTDESASIICTVDNKIIMQLNI